MSEALHFQTGPEHSFQLHFTQALDPQMQGPVFALAPLLPGEQSTTNYQLIIERGHLIPARIPTFVDWTTPTCYILLYRSGVTSADFNASFQSYVVDTPIMHEDPTPSLIMIQLGTRGDITCQAEHLTPEIVRQLLSSYVTGFYS